MGLQVQVLNAGRREIAAAFATARDRPDALLVGSGFINARRVELALPRGGMEFAIYTGRQYVEDGGLVSDGASLPDAWRQVGAYAGRILKGAKTVGPTGMQASKFEMVINAETARMLGLDIAPSLLATRRRVDRMRRRELIKLLGGAAAAGRSRRGRSKASGCGAWHDYGASSKPIRTSSALCGVSGRRCSNWAGPKGATSGSTTALGATAIATCARKAEELVALAPDLIVAAGSPNAAALQQVSRTVPIVFVGRRRPGWRRLCRQPRTPRRQHHRLHIGSNTA